MTKRVLGDGAKCCGLDCELCAPAVVVAEVEETVEPAPVKEKKK